MNLPSPPAVTLWGIGNLTQKVLYYIRSNICFRGLNKGDTMTRYESVKKWRRKVKEYAVKAFGGCCGICGYHKCINSLHFHHINPEEKEFGLSSMKVSNWPKIVKELRKCVCLCSNCHGEVEANITQIPESIKRFDEEFKIYRAKERYNQCPVCENKKKIRFKYCSKSCAAYSKRKIDWDKIDLKGMLCKGLPVTHIAKILGVSNTAVTKRIIFLGLLTEKSSRKIVRKKRTSYQTCKVRGKSHFKGVAFCSDRNKWRAQLFIKNHKRYHFGYFDNPQRAAEVYDQNTVLIYGKDAITNKKLGLL